LQRLRQQMRWCMAPAADQVHGGEGLNLSVGVDVAIAPHTGPVDEPAAHVGYG
jgi:hypothetical protein